MRAVLALLLVSCSSAAPDFSGLDELQGLEGDYSRGCGWRPAPYSFEPPDSEHACWDLYTGPEARLSEDRLSDPCDAPDLDRLVVYRGAVLWSYFDHDQAPAFKLERVKWEWCQ